MTMMKRITIALFALTASLNVVAQDTKPVDAAALAEKANQPAATPPTNSVAATVNYVATIPASPTFNRPLSCAGLSGVGTAVGFFAQEFSIDLAGSYTMTATGGSIGDTVFVLYDGPFNPASPLTNCLAFNDDANGLLSEITSPLVTGTLYTLVSTTFDNGVTGTTDVQITGPGNISLGGMPELALGMITEMDMCTAIPANNNGIIEPGETVNFTIPLSATGGDFTNVVGTLTSATAGVTIVTGMGTYGNITAGNSASANYSITVDETVACSSALDLNLAVSSTEDNFAFPISRNVGQSAAFTYNNLPLAIPDNTPAGATSTANVSGVPGAITNVQVQVNATHTWVGDLVISLTSPGGTTVTLLDQPNVPLGTFGCSNNDVNVLFADGQPDPESVCSGAPPQGNTADPWPVTDASPVPGDAMADFNGEDANGTWTLTISDNGGGDTGTLVDWELIITPVATGTCEVCPANADVSIVKTAAAPNPLTVGDTITYTLAASNAGPGPASNVVVTDPLPANVTYVSNTCGAAFAAQTVTWTIGNLASGANASCDIVVTVNAVGPINNTATISADQTDPTPANNASTAALAGAFLADVSIMKSNTANAGLAPGDAFSFILTVTNNGPTGASNIVVTDVLSDKVSYVSNNCAAVFAGNTLTWTIPALANGAEATCQIDVIFVGLGDVTNTATATAVEPDPDLSNNTATDVATVAAQPIPALNGFTLAALAALMAGLGLWMRRRYVKS
jgi:uncharacterized repeat protein (TIGR01451 family)